TPPPLIGDPISPDLPELPPSYAGDSMIAVVAALKPSPKDEFETTAAYQARVAAQRPTRTYSFWIDKPISKTYDADRQVLKVQVPVSSCTYVGYRPNCEVASVVL